MKQTNILDLESIERLIKSNNLKELSDKTGIPYDTLKNNSYLKDVNNKSI